MISRTWHGIVPKSKATAFESYLYETAIKEARAIKGNLAAYVHSVDQDEYTHFFICTIWSSWVDVLLYANNEPHISVSYPDDDSYELISDPIVIHQEVNTIESPFKRTFKK